MRTILAAMLIAAVTGWVGATGGSAAPISAAALDEAAGSLSGPTQARYYRHHGRLCYAKCYREFVIGRRVCRRFC